MSAQPADRDEPDTTPTPFQRFERLTKALLGVPKEKYDAERERYERDRAERRKQRPT